MRHLDLFAGIGGFSLAASWMGWETVAWVEWADWCKKILAKNFPNALGFGDIVEFNKMLENGKITADTNGCGYVHGELAEQSAEGGVNALGQSDEGNTHGRINLGRIDIITGGFPCQPFSHAGKRKGTDDSRYLWPAMLETIRRVKPAYVVGENVAGLVSMENGKTLDRILSDLEDEGYTTEQVIIPACAIGAWHRRDRIWIIAHSNSMQRFVLCGQQSEVSGQEQYGVGNLRYKDAPYEFSKGLEGKNKSRCDKVRKRMYLRGYPTRCSCKDVANSISGRQSGQGQYEQPVNTTEVRDRQTIIIGAGCPSDQWCAEPAVGRVANGIPNRVDRLKGLGNAIVPQVAYQIFKAIESYD